MGSGAESSVRRVVARLPAGTHELLRSGLSPTDLQTLLLDVARARAAQVTPARLLRRWSEDRFVTPTDADPRALAPLEARMWELLPAEFAGMELSPLVPLSTCAAVGAADQNRVVATMRSSEVVSDPTNVLALEAARRRRTSREPVHLAAAHRVVRAQQFAAGNAHFRLFALVSSGRDAGSGRTEAGFLAAHLQFWFAVLRDIVGPGGGAIEVSVFDDAVGPAVRAVPPPAEGDRLVEDPGRDRGRHYYTSLAMRVLGGPELAEVGDGGTTDWTARLLADAKERCLVSCVATERLLALAPPQVRPDSRQDEGPGESGARRERQ